VQRACDEVHRRRRVLDEDEIRRRCADVRGQPLPRGRDQRGVAALETEELDRLALELELQALVLVEDRPRARAERAVVEEHNVRIEQKQVTHLANLLSSWRSWPRARSRLPRSREHSLTKRQR
jgi:hypothetical protein